MADQEGLARMAAARLVAYGKGALTADDRAALRAFPEHMPDLAPDLGPEPVVDADGQLHESHQRETEMYGECITCARNVGVTAGRARAAEAAERADEHADPAWRVAAMDAVRSLLPGTEFTTDDVWARIPDGVTTHEPRALGAVMVQMAAAGEIVKTDRVRESRRPEAHANPKAVWIRATT